MPFPFQLLLIFNTWNELAQVNKENTINRNLEHICFNLLFFPLSLSFSLSLLIGCRVFKTERENHIYYIWACKEPGFPCLLPFYLHLCSLFRKKDLRNQRQFKSTKLCPTSNLYNSFFLGQPKREAPIFSKPPDLSVC